MHDSLLSDGYDKDSTEDVIKLFTSVWAIGPREAERLWNSGCRSLSDLENNPLLLKANQLIGLKYYQDLLQKISRCSVQEYVISLSDAISEYNNQNGLTILIDIAGSYRRGKEQCGDIDIVIWELDNKAFDLTSVVEFLITKDLLCETLSIGSAKYMGICKVTDTNSSRKIACRIDIYKTNKEELPYALLTYTGNKAFNVQMRCLAKSKGYKLSQYGLSHIKDNIPENTAITTSVTKESDVFDVLGLEYILPKDRDRENYCFPINKSLSNSTSNLKTSENHVSDSKDLDYWRPLDYVITYSNGVYKATPTN